MPMLRFGRPPTRSRMYCLLMTRAELPKWTHDDVPFSFYRFDERVEEWEACGLERLGTKYLRITPKRAIVDLNFHISYVMICRPMPEMYLLNYSSVISRKINQRMSIPCMLISNAITPMLVINRHPINRPQSFLSTSNRRDPCHPHPLTLLPHPIHRTSPSRLRYRNGWAGRRYVHRPAPHVQPLRP